MTNIIQKIYKRVHPLLHLWYKLYSKRTRIYQAHGIKLMVLPEVFHPGIFLSTNVFITYLKTISLSGQTILELGAGSGLISFFCSKQGANVTASDINPTAIKGLIQNAEKTGLSISIVESDLFAHLTPESFDMILVNPPYYPRDPEGFKEMAWFCGVDFEYFERLFTQLNQSKSHDFKVVMILSEDCEINNILSIGQRHNFSSELVFEQKVMGEWNYLYSFKHKNLIK